MGKKMLFLAFLLNIFGFQRLFSIVTPMVNAVTEDISLNNTFTRIASYLGFEMVKAKGTSFTKHIPEPVATDSSLHLRSHDGRRNKFFRLLLLLLQPPPLLWSGEGDSM